MNSRKKPLTWLFLAESHLTRRLFGAMLGEMVIASELVLGLYFVVIILAQVAAWSGQSKVELGRFSWNDLKKV